MLLGCLQHPVPAFVAALAESLLALLFWAHPPYSSSPLHMGLPMNVTRCEIVGCQQDVGKQMVEGVAARPPWAALIVVGWEFYAAGLSSRIRSLLQHPQRTSAPFASSGGVGV